MGTKSKALWLLTSDIHFKPYDLDRIVQSADWIASTAREHRATRAIICGDLLTTRSSQPTHVLSACYRFLDKLAGAVTHLNVIVGNHDLAYRSDYTTSALEALSIARLSPFITLHTEMRCHEWDGRRVAVMPFREDQGQIIEFVRSLDRKSAAETVGFGHLAINRAITQKYWINPETGEHKSPPRYPGLTGAHHFAPLARTFTGHFHSHQTIFQGTGPQARDAQGSITYIGAPLQLTWGDLNDTEKGVLLLDPATLEHELVRNPYGVGYKTVGAREVLEDQVPVRQVKAKHVMVTGNLTTYEYILARKTLTKLGARSVRDRKPVGSQWQSGPRLLGQTTLPADAARQKHHDVDRSETDKQQAHETVKSSLPLASRKLKLGSIKHETLDLAGAIHGYVGSLSLEGTLEGKQDLIARVGKRLCNIGGCTQCGMDVKFGFRDLLNPTPLPSVISPNGDSEPANDGNTFEAYPVYLEITNFLGVQGTLRLDFDAHLRPGMNFIIGHNGAGKSTIIEAIVWCLFGQCIRNGLGVNDVINDVSGKNCHACLKFANGFAISRYRKHGKFRNRVIVEKNGIVQPQFEGPDLRNTQAAVDRLLGIDFETFIRTVLLGNENAQSFLSSTPLQKRQLIETALGLRALDGCAEISASMLSEVERELEAKQVQLQEIDHSVEGLKKQVKEKAQTMRRLHEETTYLENELQQEKRMHEAILAKGEQKLGKLRRKLEAEPCELNLEDETLSLQSRISLAQSDVERLGSRARLAQARSLFEYRRNTIQEEMLAIKARLQILDRSTERLLEENNALDDPEMAMKNNKVTQHNEPTGKQSLPLKIMLSFKRVWAFIRSMGPRMGKAEASRAAEVRRRWDQHVGAIDALARSVAKTQISVISAMHSTGSLPSNVAQEAGVKESDVRLALRELTLQEALKIPAQLTAAIDQLGNLTKQQARLQREQEMQKQARLGKQRQVEEQEGEVARTKAAWRDRLGRHELRRAEKRQEITTYEKFREADEAALAERREKLAGLAQELTRAQSDRDVLAFWRSAFGRRRQAGPRITFRQHVTEQHLGELNKLLRQVLVVMYQDSHYAGSMTSGVIRTLFRDGGDDDGGHREEEDDDDDDNDDVLPVLESSLSIAPGIAYAKKSGGERKRVDLGLFFALFMMSEARSAHATRYMFVDEAFDSLDAAGQAAVLKWCRWMTERLEYVLVVTHSKSLVEIAEREAGAEGGGEVNVVAARAGERGTELVINGVAVCGAGVEGV